MHSPAGTSISVAGEVTFNGFFHGAARFHGHGTAVFNGGSSPGDSPAVVPFEGSVRFGPASTLTIELGATTLGSYDRLEIQRGLEAGGALAVVLLPAFAGAVGDSYEIVTAGSVTGSFSYVAPEIGQGVTLALEWTATSIRLTVAPDCNGNGVSDLEEIAQNPAQDCDGNLVLDGCDIAGGAGDSNAKGYPDTCEVSRLDVEPAGLAWTPLLVATAYEVIAGDLATLRATGGDFTAATQACLADDQPGATLPYATDPAPGGAIWFLVRGVQEAAAASSLSPRSKRPLVPEIDLNYRPPLPWTEEGVAMPVYEYVCRDCKKEFEVVRTIHDAEKKATCPKCKSTQTERQWSRVFVETSRKG